MTLYQFNLFNETQQAEILWDKGVHLSERKDHIFTYVLYQIDGFYVEVWYHREFNAIQRFRSFSSLNQLDPYLKQVRIENI